MTTLSVALTGNPNTGKSTIFNELTGIRQKIGNWPGVTVDKKVGYTKHNDRAISVMDLPGTYSINGRSPEERIVENYLSGEKPDIVVDVIDSSNIERNLFLCLQLLERRIPVLIDLNMIDESTRKGIKISTSKLEKALGMPVVETNGRSKKSTKKLLDIFTSTVMSKYKNSAQVEEHIENIEQLRATIKDADKLEEAIIEARYAFIDKVVAQTVVRENVGSNITEKIDKVLANGIVALPLLVLALYLVFEITFAWIGQPIADELDVLINEDFYGWADEALTSIGVAGWLHSLVCDGIIAGVGGVLTFVPLIFTLFFCLSFLDGTGYMARVAFVMDPIMRKAGLSGKALMPIICGFGCAVPGIMGARALDSEKDRMITILVTPFMTCGAKLPVMALFGAIFFGENADDVVFAMYLIGIIVAIIASSILSKTVFGKDDTSFVLELPPYRIPDMKTVLLETWDKGKGYLVKAGTIIFAMSVLIWFLSNYNLGGMVDDMSESFLATLGGWMSTLFVFHGFGDWEAGSAVLTGIMAKEAVISTMGILYGLPDLSPDTETVEAVGIVAGSGFQAAFTAMSALAFMVFSQLYTPCMTALGTIKKEAGGWKWFFVSAVGNFVIAWIISLIVYQVGIFLGF
ncbi:ferrous iron transport protein B [Megamonas hypermegale]|uniref:ferrous iron transport protein B n=1 Tax=Megamonas hypermegale TaxID=158847 RepID=UPI00195AF81E|nr:ferrous iron transport protein B [Megamonas hypermegale]MBM6833675.1 ferrous iron transport protein B [Megamonas hypermegale]